MMKKITLLLMMLLIASFGFSQTIPVNFDGDITVGANWKADSGLSSVAVTDLPSDTPDHGNAGELVSSASGAAWQNAQLLMTTNYIDLSDATGSKIINVDIYTTSPQDFLLKIEQTLNGTTGYSQKNFSTTGSGWETIAVDFTTPEGGDVPNDQYKLLVFFPCYSSGFANAPFDGTTYIDNVSGNVGDALVAATPNSVTVDVAANWVGYMNYFFTAADGGGFAGGDGWGVPDLKTTIGASNITLQPNYNTYNASDTFWANGAIGNKIMEASTYVEPGSTFNGADLTFSGTVDSYTLDAGYTAKFFIKALDPNNGYSDALGGAKVLDLPTSGTFTVSATASELASGLVVQYGFVVNGLNANPADEATFGSVVVSAASLSIKKVELTEFTVYPNPTQNSWTIKTKNEKISSINIFDIMGKQVLVLNPNSVEALVNASSLKIGLYFAKINTANGISSLKLVKN